MITITLTSQTNFDKMFEYRTETTTRKKLPFNKNQMKRAGNSKFKDFFRSLNKNVFQEIPK